jgi:predicted glycosyltransferase involved in capsule biosynthesis
MYKYAFTVIIGYRHRPDRLQNLRKVLSWLAGFNGVEIILVEQDNASKIKNVNLPCRYFFTKSNLPYNRSWAFNVGAKYATTDILVFGDSDLVMNPNDMIDSLQTLKDYDTVSPYRKVIDLMQHEINMTFDQLKMITRPGRGETDNRKINFSGGIVIMKKEAFLKIGGWPEEFIGWGGEDNFVTLKIEKFLKFKEMSYTCYHLPHGQEQPHQGYYQNSLNILQQFMGATNEQLVQYIAGVTPRIGLTNKYEL